MLTPRETTLREPLASTPAPASRWSKKRFVLGALAVVGLTGASLGLYGIFGDAFQPDTEVLIQDISTAKAIHVSVVPHKDSPNAPSSMKVDGYLFPRNMSDGTMAFDGRVSYVHVGQRYNFTFLEDRGFMTIEDEATGEIVQNECLEPDNIPPVQDFAEALQQARVIDSVSGSRDFKVNCTEGKLVEFKFADEPYVFCSTKNPGAVDKVHGEDVEAQLQFLEANSDGVPSQKMLERPQGQSIKECQPVFKEKQGASSSTEQSSSKKMVKTVQRVADAFNVVTRRGRWGQFGDRECSCSGGMKACLFVHGLGEDYEGPLADSHPLYWGDIHEQARCCSSIKFMRMDTVNNAWHEDKLPRQVCDAALRMAPSKDPMRLQNVAIIAHSMGNLIFSAAVMKNMCNIDPHSSMWIALQGPIIGSKSSSTAVEWCSGDPSSALVKILKYFGYCPTNDAVKSLTYLHSPTSNPALDRSYLEAAQIYRRHVTAGLCGVSPVGLASAASAKLAALSLFSKHTTKQNDGAVDFNSCQASLPVESFQNSWRSASFYKASVNHYDGSFRNGDGWWGDARKPIKWFNCQF